DVRQLRGVIQLGQALHADADLLRHLAELVLQVGDRLDHCSDAGHRQAAGEPGQEPATESAQKRAGRAGRLAQRAELCRDLLERRACAILGADDEFGCRLGHYRASRTWRTNSASITRRSSIRSRCAATGMRSARRMTGSASSLKPTTPLNPTFN